MSSIHLAKQANTNLSTVLTLSNWYQIENEQLLDRPQQGLNINQQYIVLFAAELSGELSLALIALLQSHAITAQSLCCFQPHEKLNKAFAIGVSHALSTEQLNAFKLTLSAFTKTHAMQSAYLDTPPSIENKGLLVMDMDSTAIKIECIDEIARLADVYDEVSTVTAKAMAGELSFNDSLYQRVAKLKGIKLSLIQALKNNLPLMEGVEQLTGFLKSKDWHLVIASGGFTWFAESLQTPLQLDEFYANELEIEQGQLTGRVLGEVVDANKKAEILQSIATELDLPKQQTVAIGDGANDLVMMAHAGLGVAIHGKPKVVADADAAITDGSLLQLLYFIAIPSNG